MDKDKETEEKKLRDLTPEKDAKGGGLEKPTGEVKPATETDPLTKPDPRGSR